jgi:hypothetical protein
MIKLAYSIGDCGEIFERVASLYRVYARQKREAYYKLPRFPE